MLLRWARVPDGSADAYPTIQPTNAYFGQKDIQQALLLQRMCQDLLLSHPTSENVHIVPTARDSASGLALSSRNTYLTDAERPFAPTLYRALKAAEDRWDVGGSVRECLQTATDQIHAVAVEAHAQGVKMELDYVQMNSVETFEPLPKDECKGSDKERRTPVVISGAVWLGQTRLIDNVLLSENGMILIKDHT
jgi:pantoate--beta-alanine ligase